MRSINEKCAVIAVTNDKHFDVSRLVYLGLWALQHRGQDSSGIASWNDNAVQLHSGAGLVSQVYDEIALAKLQGNTAIGHNRYSTSGGKDTAFNQPYTNNEGDFAFAHNGNLPYTDKLEAYLKNEGIPYKDRNDSGLMMLALCHELGKTGSLKKAVTNCWDLFTGAFCCVGMHKSTVFAFRDSNGIRPLALGRTHHGYVVASETVALDIIGADYLRDVKPGELLLINGSQLESFMVAEGEEKLDAFEFVYLARPDSRLGNQSIYSARRRAGQALAHVAPVKADVVLSIPDSGIPAAAGFSQASKIPFEFGLIKNRYIGRTFIEPEKIRRGSVELKFNAVVEIVAGKDIVLIDDSLVRGNTLTHVIKLLKDYGAKRIHVRLASPPVKYPDYYGVDTPNDGDLIASTLDEIQIAERIGADSVAFLPLQDFIKSTGLPEKRLCLSCFNGEYPIKVPYTKRSTLRSASATP